MKLFSRNGLILSTSLCAAVILSGIVSANKVEASSAVSYTATGKTDMRTARMFKKLLKNSQYLQVHASVKSPAKRKPEVDVAVNYTITGKTSLSNVRKLIKLFQSSKHVKVTARANVKANPVIRNQRFAFNEQGTWKINNYKQAAQKYGVYSGYQPADRVYNYNGQYGYKSNFTQGNQNNYAPYPMPNLNNSVSDYRTQKNLQFYSHNG